MKKGQVTMFIILGIILLASAMFLFYIVAEVQTSQISSESEKVISKAFQKEGLRLYVQDCLTDSLVEGLVLIGQQGRLWEGQGESTLDFSEGINGIEFTADGQYNQLYYGLTYQEDLVYPNSYPCDENTTNDPEFCQYSAPNTAKFGHKEDLGISDVESDLLKYLKNETTACVQEYLLSNLSISSNIIEEDLELEVEIETDGISIKAQYPLELNVEGQTYFHLTDFDFFYESNLRSFLTNAVTRPLISEAKNVNYNFTENELLESRKFEELSAVFEREEIADTGDTVIRYWLDPGKILQTSDYQEPYLFQFAIENRPPALDYIERESCSVYDYLVIPGWDGEEGNLNISVNALDPDNDAVEYSIDSTDLQINLEPINDSNGNTYLFYDFSESFRTGLYNISVNATDKHSLSDWQTVRVLIDRDLSLNVSLATPYDNYSGLGLITISREDPAFLKMDVPQESVLNDYDPTAIDEIMTLTYDSGSSQELESFASFLYPSNQTEYCIAFPYDERGCDVDDYLEDIENWEEYFFTKNITENPYFSIATSDGQITLDFESSYCADFPQEEEGQLFVGVTNCYSYENVNHPYSFPYHNEYWEGDNYVNETEINPFMATHSCCSKTGNELLPEGTVCYNSTPGCYASIPGRTGTGQEKGYILEQAIATCDGKRGNICGQEKEYSLYKNDLTCGGENYTSCADIVSECQGQDAWGYVDTNNNGANDAWCHGAMGCSMICKLSDNNYPIYLGTELSHRLTNTNSINELAKDYKATDDLNTVQGIADFNFACSSCNNNDGAACDDNFDGVWGTCQEGACSN